LPALYQIADSSEPQGALKALLALITKQADGLHDGIDQLWDDSFIETCQHWVVPYIGDLVGNIPLHDLDLSDAAQTAQALFTDLAGPTLEPPGAIRTRADVAKTIYYRRRKGTPAMLEELARDVTGWGAHVVEFFAGLDWNQHLEHLRLDCHGCPDLRRIDSGDRAGGPWDTASHTVDVRRINQWDGWHNIPNLGIFLWRLRAYRLARITPRAVDVAGWRLTFSPLGQDVPLFSSGRRELGESRMATEPTIEAPIRGVALFDDLRAVPPATSPALAYYGDPLLGEGSLVVRSDGTPVPAADIDCVNLGQWLTLAQPGGMRIGIDVTRGRLIVPDGRAGETITVSYFYGFSAPMGGGEYDRANWLVPETTIAIGGGGSILQNAINGRTGSHTVITIGDNATYDIDANLTLAAGESLTVQAADRARPHLRVTLPNGEWQILTTGKGSAFTLNGLLVEGALAVDGDLTTLRVLHSTLVPGRSVKQKGDEPANAPAAPNGPSLVVSNVSTRNTQLKVQIAFSIVGTLRIPSHVSGLWLLDSIVDGHTLGAAVSGSADKRFGPAAHIERTTFFGKCWFQKLPLASESIFAGTVIVDEQQQGCVRFSFVARDSKTPQQYLCQPAREIALEKEQRQNEARRSRTILPPGWDTAIEKRVVEWLVPSFEADQYGRPGFAQLRLTCPPQIRTGAADGSEMGAFCTLKQPQRESNLRMRLDEYLPVGLEAGVIYVT
jgi:hypothetical protein